MSLSLAFKKTPDYLLVEINGHWSTADALKAIEDIKCEADKHEVNHILLDLRGLSLPDTEMTRFYSGEKIAEKFQHPYKVAGYWQPEKITGFAETVAVNRSANFKMFTCEADAVNWLQH